MEGKIATAQRDVRREKGEKCRDTAIKMSKLGLYVINLVEICHRI